MVRLLSVLTCAVLVLGGCGGGSESGATDESPEPSASSTAPPERPKAGQCHQLSQDDVLGSADTEPAVNCSEKHTSETVHVGTFEPAKKGEAGALTSDDANRRASQLCHGKAASYLGTDVAGLRLTRVGVFWFVPTPEEVDAGADWLRCDVVVLKGGEGLLQLPRTMKGALGEQAGLDRYGLCGTAQPGSKQFDRVVCSGNHSWRAISTIPIQGGERYPGTDAARSAGEQPCEDQARAAQDNALEYDYGWEWPTKEQWEAGQRYGYCWSPD